MAIVGQQQQHQVSGNPLLASQMQTDDNSENSQQTGEHNPPSEDDYLELVRQLRSQLADKSDECEAMRIKLDQSNREVENLSQELDSCRLTIYINNEDSKRSHDEVLRSKKLEEDYLKLMSDYLDLGEQTNLYKQNLIENYLTKSNAINNYECLVSSGALKHELGECKLELDHRLAEMNLALAKIRNLEEDIITKDKNIQELKKTIDDAKVTHKHEVTVLEEYIHCLKNTITSYEKTLLNYIDTKA